MNIEDIGIKRILEEYLPTISQEYHDAVVAAVMKSAIIEKAFSSPGGKQVLEGAVAQITNGIIKIVSLCRNFGNTDEIRNEAMKINVTMDMLEGWAKIYEPGNEVVKTVKKLRSKN